MLLILIGLGVMCLPGVGLLVAWSIVHYRVVRKYVPIIVRIFQEKPLFIVPRGQPLEDAEAVRFGTEDGRTLHGCYLRGRGRRRGVILFGLEFGSNCWSCWSYCDYLLDAGFDVFAFESRNQGDSDAQPGYEPLQWVTDYEVCDARAALAYLLARADADPRGVGLFGISKGAGALLHVACDDPAVRCAVTDGVFATMTTLVPYMRRWFGIYNTVFPLEVLPNWYLARVARISLRHIERERRCHFPHLERRLAHFARPLLMIHGEADTYIKPDMAQALHDRAAGPKELWVVPAAKHNQALHVAGDDYRARVLAFFEQHLADGPATPAPTEPRQAALTPATGA